MLLPRHVPRGDVISTLNQRGVNAVFHYVPLHSAPAGRRLGRASGPLPVTDDCSARLVRLPLWADMGQGVPRDVVVELAAAVSSHV